MAGAIKSYSDLIAWQKAMALAKEVYVISGEFPAEERFGLASQLRRAAVSVPSNIAEGQGRVSGGEFKQFLGHARGSLFEVETQMRLAAEFGYIGSARVEQFLQSSAEVARLVNGLLKSIGRAPVSTDTDHRH